MFIWRALVDHDLFLAFSEVQKLAQVGVDFAQLIDDLLGVLHGIALLQAVPSLPRVISQEEILKEYAQRLAPDIVQLMYQTALYAKRDYIYASSAQSGFEMFLIRMSLFCAAPKDQEVKKKTLISVESLASSIPPVLPLSVVPSVPSLSAISSTVTVSPIVTVSQAPTVSPMPAVLQMPAKIAPEPSLATSATPSWETILNGLSLDVSTYSVAEHLAFIERQLGKWIFYLHPKYQLLWDKARAEKVKSALMRWCEKNDILLMQMVVEFKEWESVLSPYAQKEAYKREKTQEWERIFQEDPFVQELSSRLGASWDVSAISIFATASKSLE